MTAQTKILAALGAACWIALIATTWSTTPFWPDADGYTSHVAEGRWVAHPPGYPFFVALGHAFHALRLPAYPAVQAASLFLTLAALPLLFCLFRRACPVADALFLTMLFLFSWNVLLISRTGTSHAADYTSVSLLLLIATSPNFQAGKRTALALYGAAIALCAGLRLTTAIMMAPFFATVLLRYWKRPALWAAYAAAGAVVIAVQLAVIHLSGGWLAYREYSHAMHLGNLTSSLMLSGVNGATLLNLARTLGWWLLSVPASAALLVFIPWKNLRLLSPAARDLLLYGGISALGCLGMAGLYLCTHPGYISGTLPGTFACLAALLPLARPAARVIMAVACLAAGPGLFLLARPFAPPRSPAQAAANGLLLQYSGAGMRQSLFKTTAGWLREAGYDRLVPEHRRRTLDEEAHRHSPN